MNVDLIQMDRWEASSQLRVYERAIKRGRKPNAEYEAVAKGLAALANGTPLLNLSNAFAQTGFDVRGMPKLAIARSDRKKVRCSWWRPWRLDSSRSLTSSLYFDSYADRGPVGNGLIVGVEVPADKAPRWDVRREAAGETLVPMIPPQVREAVRFADDKTFILWEVEKWTMEPPRDPYLLRHISGDTYAVLAEWDLTEMERAIMAGRRGAH